MLSFSITKLSLVVLASSLLSFTTAFASALPESRDDLLDRLKKLNHPEAALSLLRPQNERFYHFVSVRSRIPLQRIDRD